MSGQKLEPVSNKQPAPMQITAEQILREARERQEDDNYEAPAQKARDGRPAATARARPAPDRPARLRR